MRGGGVRRDTPIEYYAAMQMEKVDLKAAPRPVRPHCSGGLAERRGAAYSSLILHTGRAAMESVH